MRTNTPEETNTIMADPKDKTGPVLPDLANRHELMALSWHLQSHCYDPQQDANGLIHAARKWLDRIDPHKGMPQDKTQDKPKGA
jgi:hypothetical protein